MAEQARIIDRNADGSWPSVPPVYTVWRGDDFPPAAATWDYLITGAGSVYRLGENGWWLMSGSALAAPPPPVQPGPPVSVTIGAAVLPLAGVDVYRDTNQLVAYTSASGSVSPANVWGKEVKVVGGKVASAATTSPVAIPAGGYVLSGHYSAGTSLAAAAAMGADVTLKDAAGRVVTLATGAAPPPTPPPSGSFPANMIGAYKKMFSGDPGALASYPSSVNVVFLAFAAQHSGPLALVGYSAQGKASLMADIAARRAAGGRVSISIGGAGNPINTSNTTGFVNDFMAIGTDLGFTPDGIDWDLEHTNNTAQIVAISNALKAHYGAGFAVTYSVGGVGSQADIDNRVSTGLALHQAGALDAFSWQLYDTVVDLPTAKWRLGTLIQAGLPASKVTVGMMLGADNNHWDNAECRTYMADIRATLGITKTALWTESWSAADTQWAADMATVLA